MGNLVFETMVAFTLISLSWVVGYLVHGWLCKLELDEGFLMRNTHAVKLAGDVLRVDRFRWLLVNTPLRHTSDKVRIRSGGTDELERVRSEMKESEISHHLGFWLIQGSGTVYLAISGRVSFYIVLSMLNICLNLYPVLVQIRTLARVDEVIKHRKL